MSKIIKTTKYPLHILHSQSSLATMENILLMVRIQIHCLLSKCDLTMNERVVNLNSTVFLYNNEMTLCVMDGQTEVCISYSTQTQTQT